MKKSSFISLKTATPVAMIGLLSLLLLQGCGKDGQVSNQFTNNITAQDSLNPLSKGEQLNPVSKGEQLNPISKGEQLNPGSKGERIVSGELSLLGASRFIPNYALQFFLDGKPVPTDWLRLSNQGEQILAYQLQNMPTENIHILEVRYLGETLSTMMPPGEPQTNNSAASTVLNLNLRSSLVVDTVRFADADKIIGFADWTPELLDKLMTHSEIEALLSRFNAESTEQTPTILNQWLTQASVQQQLRTLLNNLR
jgi:hypothetical protein